METGIVRHSAGREASHGGPGARRAGGGWCVAILLVSAGCTMCPDPFDYSGPVPNGSPPHNDFRARSNGILPLGVAPQPFPPLVDDEEVQGAPASDPDGSPDDVETTAVIATSVEDRDEAVVDGDVTVPEPIGEADSTIEAEPAPQDTAVDLPKETPVTAPSPEPEAPEAVAVVERDELPGSRETPGWRAIGRPVQASSTMPGSGSQPSGTRASFGTTATPSRTVNRGQSAVEVQP